MSTCTTVGTISFPVFALGPSSSVVIGSPLLGPSTATTGHQVTFTEGGLQTLKITAAGTQAVAFNSVASGAFVYIGCSKACEVTLDGSDTPIALADGGMIIVSKAGLISISIEAGVLDTEVAVILLGD